MLKCHEGRVREITICQHGIVFDAQETSTEMSCLMAAAMWIVKKANFGNDKTRQFVFKNE